MQPISLDDFFTKSLEFKFWLKHKKKKFIDQLESSKSKKYFGKFVRHWNDGRLDQDYYNPPAHWRTSSASTSSHAWTFTGATTLDREKAKNALREAHLGPSRSSASLLQTDQKPIIGPSLPSNTPSSSNLAEHQFKQDEEREAILQEKAHQRRESKRRRQAEKEEESANRATGKQRLIEKRKEKRDAQSEYQRTKEDPTAWELDDRSMFGSNNSFQDALRARDRAQERRMGKNSARQVEKQLVMQEKMTAMRSKEDETMAMLKAMAASKFGSGSKS